MKRPIRIVRRSCGVVAALAMVASVLGLQVSGAHAAGMSVTKSVCVYTTGACAAATAGTATATTGDVLQYTFNFSGATAGQTTTVTDQLQGGQTYLTCGVASGATCSASTNSTTGVTTVTFSFPNVASSGTGWATLYARVTATSGTISNAASAVQSTAAFDATACAALGTGYSASNGYCVIAPTTSGGGTCPALTSAESTALGNAGFANYSSGPTSGTSTCAYNFNTSSGISTDQIATAKTECAALGGTAYSVGSTVFNCLNVPQTTATQTCPSGFALSGNGSTAFCTRALVAAGVTAALSSNTTVVTVTSTAVPTTPVTTPVTTNTTGNVTICGPVQAYTSGGALTISGVTYMTNSGTVITGSPIQINGNVCSNITVNVNNQVTNINVYPNQTQVSYICSNVGNNNVANCSLINNNGTVVGNLSALPVAAHAVGLDGTYRTGYSWSS